jgi:hypothetical protein
VACPPLLRRDHVIVGVDVHKNEHAAVLLDGLDGELAELTIPPPPQASRNYWKLAPSTSVLLVASPPSASKALNSTV